MSSRVNSHLRLSLHASLPEGDIAFCAGTDLPEGEAPEWVHLVPAGTIRTYDGRGPYRLTDPAAVVAASLQNERGMVLDENHATDLAVPNGAPSPASGWISALEARPDGIWGKVDWTPRGRQLMAERAYRHISPVITYDRNTMEITSVARASLVNKPNFKGLRALQSEMDMDLLHKLAQKLGLAETVSEEALVAAVEKLQDASSAAHAELAPIAQAVGLAADASATDVLGAVNKLRTAPNGKTVEALQAELAEVTTRLNALTEATARKAAETFVDGAIKAGRVGVKPMRDEYIAMHMEDAERAEKLINAMPILAQGSVVPKTPPKEGDVELNAEQTQVARLLGLDPKAVEATAKREREAAL